MWRCSARLGAAGKAFARCTRLRGVCAECGGGARGCRWLVASENGGWPAAGSIGVFDGVAGRRPVHQHGSIFAALAAAAAGEYLCSTGGACCEGVPMARSPVGDSPFCRGARMLRSRARGPASARRGHTGLQQSGMRPAAAQRDSSTQQLCPQQGHALACWIRPCRRAFRYLL